MAKYENKFIIINRKHLDRMPPDLREKFMKILEEVERYLPKHEYVVINKDEPYFPEIKRIMLEREEKKEKQVSKG